MYLFLFFSKKKTNQQNIKGLKNYSNTNIMISKPTNRGKKHYYCL